jgi:hypothetical protein
MNLPGNADEQAILRLVYDKFTQAGIKIQIDDRDQMIGKMTNAPSGRVFRVMPARTSRSFLLIIDDQAIIHTTGMNYEPQPSIKTTSGGRSRPVERHQFNIKVSAADPDYPNKLLRAYLKFSSYGNRAAWTVRSKINVFAENVRSLVKATDQIDPQIGTPIKEKLWAIRQELTMASRRMEELEKLIESQLGGT